MMRHANMRRRDFLIGTAMAVAIPLEAAAQQPRKQHRLAFVHSGIPADKLTKAAGPFWIRRFYETLERLGHGEGGNLVVERYSAEGHSDRFAALAAEVVGRKPDVIVSNLNALIKTFLAATATIPIVGITSDPVASGLKYRAGQSWCGRYWLRSRTGSRLGGVLISREQASQRRGQTFPAKNSDNLIWRYTLNQ